MTVYGHTLAWHSQQNNKYLNSLIKDKELEIDPDAKWTTSELMKLAEYLNSALAVLSNCL